MIPNWVDDITKDVIKYPNKYGAQKDAKIILQTEGYALYERPYMENGKYYNVYVSMDRKGKVRPSRCTMELIRRVKGRFGKHQVRKRAIWVEG